MSINHKHNDQLLAEALPEGIVILNEEDGLNWWNHHARVLLGLDHTKHQSKCIVKILTGSLFLDLMEGRIESNRIEIDSPWEEELRLAISLRPYWGQQKLLIVQDITHTHRLEAMRQDFIANISHELRTPLTVFRGYLDLLQEENNIETMKLKEILQQMRDQSRRMEQLVQDLLLLAHLESFQPDIRSHQQVPVASMLKNIVEDAKSLSGEKQHQFVLTVDETLQLEGQSEELRSAFSNIIYNAVHYTPVKGMILVDWYHDKNGKHMRVTDNGIGIAAKYIPRITQRFYCVDKARSSKGRGGTGLGLAIAKHVILRHGGVLSIKSKLNEGSTFCCTFF